MATAEIARPDSSSNDVTEISFTGFLAAFGGGLLLFGSRGARIFGATYIGIAFALFVYQRWGARWWTRESTQRWVVALAESARSFLARLSRHSRWLMAGAGVVSLAAAVGLYQGASPAPVPIFYAVFGLACFILAATSRSATDTPDKGRRAVVWAGSALGLAAVAAIFGIVVVYGTNSFFLDEGVTLDFILAFPGQTWQERATALVGNHIVHRIASTRLTALAQQYLFGQVDFRGLAFISNVYLVGFSAVLFASLPREKRKLLYFAPFLLLFFQLQYYILTVWGFSIPHFSVLFFSALALWFIERNTTASLVLASLASVAAAYSFGVGVFITLIVLVYLIADGRYKHATYWLVPSALVTLRYFEAIPVDMQQAAAANYGIPEATLGAKLIYVLEFLGSAFSLGAYADILGENLSITKISPLSAWVVRAAGGITLLAFVVISAGGYWKRNKTVYGMLLLTLISALLAADQRNREFAPPLMCRYSVNSCLFVALLYLAFLETSFDAVRRRIGSIIVLAALFCAASYVVGLPHVWKHSGNLRYTVLTASNNIYQGITPDREPVAYYSTELIGKALAKGVYSIPQTTILKTFAAPKMKVTDAAVADEHLPVKVLSVAENDFSYTFFLGADDTDKEHSLDSVGVALANGSGGRWAFEATPLEKMSVNPDVVKGVAPEGTTHVAVVPKADVGSEQLSLALVGVENGAVRWSGTPVQLPTVWIAEPALASLGLPEIVHQTGRCLMQVNDAEAHCSVVLKEDDSIVKLPPVYSVEVIFRTQATFPPSQAKVLWSLEKLPGNFEEIRLALEGEFMVVSRRVGAEWAECSRLAVSVSTWNWCAVTLDGPAISQFASAFDPATGQLGQLFIASDRKRSKVELANTDAVLTTGGSSGPSGSPLVEVREIRIAAGALTPEAIGQHWPVFHIP